MKTVSILLNFVVIAMAAVAFIGFLTSIADTSAQTGYPPPEPPAGTPAFGPYRLNLPLVQKNYQFIKSKSGIHLGSGVQGNWSVLMQTRLTGGNASQGVYPAVIVILSSDLFNYVRGGPACRISGINASNPVKNQALYNYLTDAARKGTKIVIRIFPSPGNFQNVLGMGSKTLLTQPGERPPKPGGGLADYCSLINGRSPDTYFRSVDDIAQEMIVIRDYTSNASGWRPYAFEPANEPNSEWYPIVFEVQNAQNWAKMDAYFTNVYLQVHPNGTNSDIRVLAVPMAQSYYAEERNIIDCSPYGDMGGRSSGLEWMENTWMESVNGSHVNYNDGWSWHNYWKPGEEGATSDNSCSEFSGHNFQAFTSALKSKILNSPDLAFITEADVYSPCIGDVGSLPDKGEAGNNPNGTNAAFFTKISFGKNGAQTM
jgi:hypothetical protein